MKRWNRKQEVVLTDEPTQEVAVIVDCPRAVPVQVVTRSGQPALETKVEYEFSLPDRGGNMTTEAVDADGWTQIPCVPLGTTLRIQAQDEAEGAARLVYVVTPQNEPAILRLEALEKAFGS
jgi:hypothetical protein